MEISVPRDRDASFEPRIFAKRQRRLTGVDELVISLSAKGLTHGEIAAHLAEVYGAEVSKQTITTIIDRSAVDLNLLQQAGDLRRHTTRRPQRPGRVAAFPRSDRPHRIQLRDPAQHRPPRWNRQATNPALPCDLPAHRRHRVALPRQVPRPQHLAHDRLNLGRQPTAAAAAAGPARQQVRNHALTRAPPPDQHIHLTP
jgi:hypothetical protein